MLRYEILKTIFQIGYVSDISLAGSDIVHSDILFAFQTRAANTTRRKLNITAKQYHSPEANKTAQLLYEKLGKAARS